MLGARIKHYRKKRGLTQYELAERANISRSYLADMERERYNPSVDTLLAISRALHIELHDLIGEEKEKSSPAAADPVGELIHYLDMELSDAEIVERMNFRVDNIRLSKEEALEFVQFVRVRRLMKNINPHE